MKKSISKENFSHQYEMQKFDFSIKNFFYFLER